MYGILLKDYSQPQLSFPDPKPAEFAHSNSTGVMPLFDILDLSSIC
jgi:hypothetical protein